MSKVTTEKGIKKVEVFFLMIFVVYVVDYQCPFLKIFHIPCLGCGMTRATISLMNLNFSQALQDNFLIYPLIFFCIGWFILKYLKLDGKLKVASDYSKQAKYVQTTLIALMLCVWGVKIYFFVKK